MLVVVFHGKLESLTLLHVDSIHVAVFVRIQVDLPAIVGLKGALIHGRRPAPLVLLRPSEARPHGGPTRFTGLPSLARLFTRCEQAQALQNMRRNVERVELWLQELGCDR